jgi:hypothetical protein
MKEFQSLNRNIRLKYFFETVNFYILGYFLKIVFAPITQKEKNCMKRECGKVQIFGNNYNKSKPDSGGN